MGVGTLGLGAAAPLHDAVAVVGHRAVALTRWSASVTVTVNVTVSAVVGVALDDDTLTVRGRFGAGAGSQ